MKIKNVGLALGMILLSSISLVAQYQLGHTTITFNDPARTGGFGSGGGPGRQIQTEIYYPASVTGSNVALAPGEHPIIIFGHGFNMVWSAYENIWERYATQGYIIAFPRTEGGLSPSHNEFALDLKIAEEKLKAFDSDPTSLFYQHFNGRSAIMGHSMGGGASVLAAANNTSITTMVLISGADTNPSAIVAAADVTVPSLVFAAGGDKVTPPADHQLPIYNALASDCKSYVTIVGAAHCGYGSGTSVCEAGEGAVNLFGSDITLNKTQQQDRFYSVLDPWLAYTLKLECSAYPTFVNMLTANTAQIDGVSTCSANPIPTINVNNFELTSDVTGVTYQWYLNDQPIDGSVNQVHDAIVSGDYTVEVFFEDGCSEFSDEVNIDVCVSISQPEVQVDGDNLVSSEAGATYQWYLNGNAITGATSQIYTPEESGLYSVSVTYPNDCESTSVGYDYTFVEDGDGDGDGTASIENHQVSGIAIYPNPTEGIVFITYEGDMKDLDVKVFSIYGQEVDAKLDANQVDLTNLPSGMYVVKINTYSVKVMKK